MLAIKCGFFNIKTTSSAILVSVLIVISIKPKRSEVLQSFAWLHSFIVIRLHRLLEELVRICIQCIDEYWICVIHTSNIVPSL